MLVRSGHAMIVAMLLIALVFLCSFYAADAQSNFRRSHIRMQKLCSRKLSDALYLICRERGYNEPFSYSNEDEPRVDPGPGLVDECCYHQCTLGMLEAYCKPLPEEKRAGLRDDVIDQSYLANLPHSTTKELLEQHPQTEMDYAGDAIKRKVDDLKREQHMGKSGRNVDGECKGKADAKKQHRGRHCRCRRRRPGCRRAGKVSRSNVKSLDNKFVTSTTYKPTSFLSVS